MGNVINAQRHYSIFDPVEWGERPVHVIGAGATGSKIALELAKLGIQNLTVYDFDVVESHNIANQLYGLADIGKPKVEALANHIKAATNLDIKQVKDRVTGSTPLSGVVFLLTDTMASRKDIWDGALRMKINVELMIETRMGVDSGRIYTIIPTDRKQGARWEKTLISDDAPNLEVSPCGSTITIGPTAGIIAGLAVWQFIRFYNVYIARKSGDSLEQEIMLGLRDSNLLTLRF